MYLNEPLVTIISENEDKTKSSYALPEPTSYSGTTSTMIDSGTSVSGQLLGSVVREDVARISLSWNFLSVADWAKMNKRFKEHYINKIRFFDQTLGDWDERDMYVSDRSAGMWRRDAEGNVLGWTGCGLELTEV